MMKSCLIVLSMILVQTVVASGQDAQIKGRDVDIGEGIKLHVIERGEGEAIIFIHGLTGDWFSWHRQVPAFAKEGFRAIGYSRRYNHPNKNKAKPGHSAIREAADLERLMAKLGVRKVHLVGHSYGAYTALMFALKHPGRVKTLALAEPPIVPWPELDPRPASGRCEGAPQETIRGVHQPCEGGVRGGGR